VREKLEAPAERVEEADLFLFLLFFLFFLLDLVLSDLDRASVRSCSVCSLVTLSARRSTVPQKEFPKSVACATSTFFRSSLRSLLKVDSSEAQALPRRRMTDQRERSMASCMEVVASEAARLHSLHMAHSLPDESTI